MKIANKYPKELRVVLNLLTRMQLNKYQSIQSLLAYFVILNQLIQIQAKSAYTTNAEPTLILGEPPHIPALTSTQLNNQDVPIRAIHYHFDHKMDTHLYLHKFNYTSKYSNLNSATCNDGSPAGYYKRLNNHSKTWIIYLQGGGFCGSEEMCRQRWRRSPQLMSSDSWPNSRTVDGILSSEPKDNPYLWNANHIYVPYCSSDSWTGSRESRADELSSSSFAFMGSRVIEKVLNSLFDELPREFSLHEAKFILLAGDSAGATGVIMNLDKVNRLVQQRFNHIKSSDGGAQQTSCAYESCDPHQRQLQNHVPVVRGIADSGWFLDNEPYDYTEKHKTQQQQESQTSSFLSTLSSSSSSTNYELDQTETIDCDKRACTPLQSVKQAMLYWNGQVPVACAVKHMSEPWRCYFAYRTYRTLRTPLFVVQWLYDEAQLMVDNIIRPGTISQWSYVNKLVNDVRLSLENVTALFAPSCFSHSLIIKKNWNEININGFKLPHILNSWEEEVLTTQPKYETLLLDVEHATIIQQQHPIINSNHVTNERSQQHNQGSFDQRNIGTYRSWTSHSVVSGGGGGDQLSTSSTSARPKTRKKKRNNSNLHRLGNSNSNRLSRSTPLLDDATIVFNNNVPEILVMSASRQQEASDKFRLIDTCGWPQCNRDCPNLEQDFNTRS